MFIKYDCFSDHDNPAVYLQATLSMPAITSPSVSHTDHMDSDSQIILDEPLEEGSDSFDEVSTQVGGKFSDVVLDSAVYVYDVVIKVTQQRSEQENYIMLYCYDNDHKLFTQLRATILSPHKRWGDAHVGVGVNDLWDGLVTLRFTRKDLLRDWKITVPFGLTGIDVSILHVSTFLHQRKAGEPITMGCTIAEAAAAVPKRGSIKLNEKRPSFNRVNGLTAPGLLALLTPYLKMEDTQKLAALNREMRSLLSGSKFWNALTAEGKETPEITKGVAEGYLKYVASKHGQGALKYLMRASGQLPTTTFSVWSIDPQPFWSEISLKPLSQTTLTTTFTVDDWTRGPVLAEHRVSPVTVKVTVVNGDWCSELQDAPLNIFFTTPLSSGVQLSIMESLRPVQPHPPTLAHTKRVGGCPLNTCAHICSISNSI
eukprot:Blabericola_migrator_1__4796@NODE_251_length_10854_cov_130_762121_g212_i0_p3_GENE_NODE_251_length_10854_cov_130_762121_g212_i0NODE_251_length_10854_cov_130_762121_g212_i0_p3_ORF_typecomplete_len427_score50_61_NODE_251_length_10854_cov_130_762121_g212_i0950110781